MILIRPTQKVFMFDCFNTVFQVKGIRPKQEMRDYVGHVRSPGPWKPLALPEEWKKLPPFPDSVEGIKRLQALDHKCVALTNAPREVTEAMSSGCGIQWDLIVALEEIQVYKPNPRAYTRIHDFYYVERDQLYMVTANLGAGDLEAAVDLGMHPVLIREDADDELLANNYMDIVALAEHEEEELGDCA